MSENNFTELYKTWLTVQLLDIVENPNDYQPLAVSAAQMELDSRGLSQEELAAAKEIQTKRSEEKLGKQQKVEAFEEKIKSVSTSFVNQFNPIQQGTLKINQHIKLISLFLILLSLYKLYSSTGILSYMFVYEGRWEISMVFYLIEFLIVPVATVLFWLRKQLGWILAVVYFSFAASSAFVLLIFALSRQFVYTGGLDIISPTALPIISLLLFALATWGMTKKNIRDVYRVNSRTMLVSIGTGLIVMMLSYIAIYF